MAGGSQAQLDVLKSLTSYVNRIINHRSINGMRVLILDDFTTQVVSTTTSLSKCLNSQGLKKKKTIILYIILNRMEFVLMYLNRFDYI